MYTKTFFTVFALLFLSRGTALGQQGSRSFADRILIGAHAGRVHNYKDTYWNFYSTEWYWAGRAGISLNKRWYTGFYTGIVQARNFETDWQSFYIAGLWVRRYFIRPVVSKSNRRLGVFGETGLLASNYAFSYTNLSAYFKSQNGQLYLPLALGVEWRLIEHLTFEGGLRLNYNAGKSWNLHGFAYFNFGFNWHFL